MNFFRIVLLFKMSQYKTQLTEQNRIELVEIMKNLYQKQEYEFIYYYCNENNLVRFANQIVGQTKSTQIKHPYSEDFHEKTPDRVLCIPFTAEQLTTWSENKSNTPYSHSLSFTQKKLFIEKNKEALAKLANVDMSELEPTTDDIMNTFVFTENENIEKQQHVKECLAQLKSAISSLEESLN